MRSLIENYRNQTAGHCGSGAMRNLLYHYCKLDLPEGVVFGLGSGLDAAFFNVDHVDPPFMLFGRSGSMETDLTQALDIDYRETLQADDTLAWQEVRDEVAAGNPTMLAGDIYYLDYRKFKVHFPGHRYVLLGYDDERDEAYVADRTDEATQTCSTEAVRLSRNAPIPGMSSQNRWGKFHDSRVGNSLPEACGKALRITVERMLGIDTSQRAAMAEIQKGQSQFLEIGLAGLTHLNKEMGHWAERGDASSHARYVDNAIVKFGTGGGFFRDLFAEFMRWSKEQRPDLVGSTTVMLAEQSAVLWNDLAPTMATLADTPNDQPLWRQAQEQVLDIHETEYALFGHLADTVLRTSK